jgi:hypothetical protein
MAKKYNDKGMVSEDMSQPSNLPREVVSKHYGKCPGADYDYDGSEHAMYMQALEDKSDMKKQPAKRRY